jgi:hypothetical protein
VGKKQACLLSCLPLDLDLDSDFKTLIQRGN